MLVCNAGVEQRHPVRLPRIGVDLVGDEEIVQRRLQHERRRLSSMPSVAFAGGDQQLVDRPPWRVVPDRDRRVQNQPIARRQGGVVDDLFPSTTEFGIDTTTFFIVRTWVASSHVSTTSPTVSPILTRSPR